MKREAALKALFLKELKKQLPTAVVFPHQEIRRSGVPDVSITIGKLTTWWEFKHATPDFESPGIQALTCSRLALAGHCCRYVVYWESEFGTAKRTMIVHPKIVYERVSTGSSQVNGALIVPEEVTPGFDHKWLVQQVREWHKV